MSGKIIKFTNEKFIVNLVFQLQQRKQHRYFSDMMTSPLTNLQLQLLGRQISDMFATGVSVSLANRTI